MPNPNVALSSSHNISLMICLSELITLFFQCDLCLEALGIDWYAIRDRGVERGIVVSRVPIRDFDHGDQTLMLPEAVRTLAMLLALNNKVYVHCTAGINRATLTTLGYLTFVQVENVSSRLIF